MFLSVVFYNFSFSSIRSKLCDTPDCPYLGRAACVQPFCAALRVVPQVGAAPAVGAASGLGPGTNVP